MKELINVEKTEISNEYYEAVATHQRIMANGEICAQTLLEICKDLKKMRDEKLYEEFGYQSFDEYCEKMAGIKSRMAYNYISTYERLGSSVLQSNARLGITKLELIAGMNPEERANLLESGEAETMSAAEIRELLKKSKEQGEQISFLETELEKLKSENDEAEDKEHNTEADELRDTVENLKKELSEQKIAHENELEAVRKEAAEAAKKDMSDDKIQKEIDTAVASAVASAKKEAVKEAKEKFSAQAEQQRNKINELEAALSAAGTVREKLEKQLQLSDTESAKAMVYIQAIQDNFNQLSALIVAMPEEQQNRFKGAVLKITNAIQKQVEE